MAATILDTFNSQIEQVAETVATYWQFDTQLAGKIGAPVRAKATRYLYRIPIQLYPGGIQMKYIANRGDMGSGSSMKLTHLTAGFLDSLLNFEITKEQIDLSKTSEQSRVDIFSKQMADMTQVANAHDNIDLHGDGTGKLTNASSAKPSTTTLTFNGTADYLGVNRLFDGRAVDVWDTAGTTLRAGGPHIITAIDWDNKIVTFDSAVTGLTSGDLLSVYNVDVYGPAAPTSFSSTWPGGGTTNAPGLTGDSWRHGLEYCNDATPSNYYLGRLKSTIPQLSPIKVDASSNPLTFSHGELGKNLMIQKRGQEILDGLMVVMHNNQQHRLKDTNTTISRIALQTTGNKIVDILPSDKYTENFTFADLPACCSRNHRRNRVDAFNPKLWGRVEGHPSQVYEVGGQRLFPLRDSTTVNLKAGVEWKLAQKFDWVNEDPGASFYITGLTVTPGYGQAT